MHETSVGLVVGEGISIGVWGGRAVDNEWNATVEGVGGRVEGVLEVVALVHLTSGEGWSLEA